MQEVMFWIAQVLIAVLAAAPFLCWGWLTRERSPGIRWWLAAAFIGVVYALNSLDSVVFAALTGLCFVAFVTGRRCWHRLGRPEALVTPIPWLALLLAICAHVPRLAFPRFVLERLFLQPAAMGAISVVVMLAGYAVAWLVLHRKFPSAPYGLAALAAALINPFHPYRAVACFLGAATGWCLAYYPAGGTAGARRPLLRLMGLTFVFWFLADSAWSVWMEPSFPFSSRYAEMFLLDLALSLFYGCRLKSITATAGAASARESQLAGYPGAGWARQGSPGFWPRTVPVAVLLFIWGAGMLAVGARYPLFVAAAACAWALGLTVGKSTVVSVDPTQIPFSPRIRLSHREFDSWARHMVLTLANERFFGSTMVHWTNKMGVVMECLNAWTHVSAIGWCVAILLPMDILLGSLVFSPDFATKLAQMPAGQRFGFGAVSAIVLGHLGGHASGMFYRWVRAKW